MATEKRPPAKKSVAKKAASKKSVAKKSVAKSAGAAKSRSAAAPKRAATPPHPPEPNGGPFARREAFTEQRTTRLTPKADTDEGARPGRPAAAGGPGRADDEPGVAPPMPRRQAIAKYRGRQEREVAGPAEADDEEGGVRRRLQPVPIAAVETHRGARTPDEEAEDDYLGPEPDFKLDGEPAMVAEPPVPPAPPPANNWIPLGPSVLRKGQGATLPSTSGRCMGIAVASGGDRVYAAAANGGVWRSDDAGRTWRSLMDAWDLNPTALSSDSLACGSIAIDPTNPDRIFVGSGDGDEAIVFGVGPIVSTDGGTNWITEPVAAGSPALDGTSMNAMAVDPNNTNRVVAGTFNGVYRRQPRTGGGFEWARKTGPTGMISSVVVAQSGGTTTFFAAPFSGPVYSSTDGHTWSVLGTGFPSTDIGRVGLAVRASDPTVVYALVAKASDNQIHGVYRLRATEWKTVSGAPADLFGTAAIGGQGTYDLAIAVDPNDINRLYLGGSTKASGGEWSGSVYRCAVSSSGTGTATTYSMTSTYIGASVHADIHALAFAPGDSNKLWLGCDGGVYYSTTPTGSGNVFEARNTGLQTMTMNRVDHHPTEDAVLFAGTQDNGGVRYTGEEAWFHSVWGDAGDFVINWADPYRLLATYVRKSVNRSTDGGTRYNYSAVNVPAAAGDSALFYAPLAGTPPSATPADANRVAFGSRRVWISETFGGGWTSIPNNDATDDLGERVSALRFASATVLHAATTNGRVFRFTRSGAGTWSRTRIDNVAGGALPLAGWIRSIAIDPSDASGNSIYIAFAGNGDFRHVWRFNGTAWAARSGPSAGNPNALLDIQHNAIVCDPANPATVYVGADIGVWRSTDAGVNWAPFSSGLPDAAVLDLDLHQPRRLLRASTYGRGVFEFRLDAAALQGVELYVRDTQLDQGRFTTTDFLNDPTEQGTTVRHWAGPDIKVDTPDDTGAYQFPITAGTTIDFEQFTNVLSDDSKKVATHGTSSIVSRVYVQIHNRGVTPADNVRVMCLLANASAGLPPLPAGFAANVQSGAPITTANWRTIGVATLNDLRVGFPKVAAFDLPSSLLPPPTSLAGNDHHCVLALVHHAADPFTATQTVTDLLSLGERKAAHKNLKVVEFTGTVPSAAPVMMAVRINNPSERRAILTSLVFRLNGYPAGVRVFVPKLPTDGRFVQQLKGLKPASDTDLDLFTAWAGGHVKAIERNLHTERHYDREWSAQRIDDVHAVSEARTALVVTNTKEARINNIILAAGQWRTVFLAFDRPKGAEVGSSFPVEIVQLEAKRGRIIGGLETHIDVTKSVRRARPAGTPRPHRARGGAKASTARSSPGGRATRGRG